MEAKLSAQAVAGHLGTIMLGSSDSETGDSENAGLPPGWQAVVSSVGETYYLSTVSGATTWEVPTAPWLPEGWAAVTSESTGEWPLFSPWAACGCVGA